MRSGEIIENCPARVLFTDGYFCKQTDGNTLCSDCTDCAYKQLQYLINENENLKRKLRDLTLLVEVITKENFKYKEAFKEIKHIFKIHEEELYETLHTPIDGMVLKIIDEVLI